MSDSAHPSPERLAAVSTGDDDAQAVRHAAGCSRCTAELAQLHTIVGSLRGVGADELPAPPEHVWHRIEEETGLEATAGSPRARPADTVVPLHAVREHPRAGDQRPVRRQPSRRTAVLVAAALVVGVGLGAGIGALREPSTTPEAPVAGDVRGTVVARAVLDATAVGADGGAAQLLRTDEGYRLWVEVTAPPADARVREVWLLDGQDRLLSLGVLGSSEAGAFGVPEAAVDSFDVVDVSAEPLDGDPAHSGVTLFRGRLAPG